MHRLVSVQLQVNCCTEQSRYNQKISLAAALFPFWERRKNSNGSNAAIEQNAKKPNGWGQLACEGYRVVQLKDTQINRFVAVAD